MELLAPAGNMACLHAAVRAGADAVYLGIDRFNARRGADNFTMDTLREACDYAHLRGVRVYLTVNIAILPSEAQAAMEVVRQGYRAGVDAFIVQDLGLAAQMRRTLPEADLHVSTQMNVLNAAGVEAAAKLGAARVTFARELELAEIAELSSLAAERGMDTEVFAHGAICICYSGQCYMSSLVGGRSANRGMCAQACRLPYELHNKAVKKPLPSEGDHLLSPKDLCTVDLIPELAVAGAGSLKIEGRMKSPEYVQAVVGVYRDVLDRTEAWLSAQPEGADLPAVPQNLRATEEEHRILSEAFSRGFTQAYLTHDDGNQMMSYGRPNNRGVFVGRVASVRAGSVLVHPEEELSAGDVLEFWTNRGHFAYTLAEGDLLANGDARIALSRKVGPGDRVFRVRSAKAAFVDDALAPKVPVQGRAVLRIGDPVRFELVASDGSFGCAMGPVVEAARTKAVSEDEVRAHLDRFGNEPFALSRLDVELDEGVGIGFSQLHKVRAQASRALEEDLLASPTTTAPFPKLPRRPSVPVWAAAGRSSLRRGRPTPPVPGRPKRPEPTSSTCWRSTTSAESRSSRARFRARSPRRAIPTRRSSLCPWPTTTPFPARGRPVSPSMPGTMSRRASPFSPKASPSCGGPKSWEPSLKWAPMCPPSTPGPSTCSRTGAPNASGSRPNLRSVKSSRSVPTRPSNWASPCTVPPK